MDEQTFHSLPQNKTEPTAKQSYTSPPGPSSASDEKPASSKPASRRKSSPTSPAAITIGKLRESARQRQKARSMPQRGQDTPSQCSLMVPSLPDSNNEITYTPTTHRISKAKKGKKVHACEYPGCTKIFTRAEHRKRHEVNHNLSPAFQCEIEGCQKPFQRADLLARHMERQHNMSSDTSTFRSPYMQHSTIGPSSPSARDSIGAPRLGAQASTPGPSLPQPSGTMSIGSIIEPNMQNGFKSDFAANPGPALHELSHTPTGTVPRTLPPELLYGQDSPLYSSSDSCYSPLSDYLQPQVAPEPFYPPPETLDEHVHSTTIDTYYQPIEHSPLSAGPPTPTWIQYVPAQLSFENETPCQAPHRQFQFHSPSWPGANCIPPYEIATPPHQAWSWEKVSL